MPHIGYKPLVALCRRLSMALGAGIDIRTVLAREVPRAARRGRGALRLLSDQVAAGGTLGEAVGEAGDYFPELFRQVVVLGDQTGKLSEVFGRLADHYEEQVRLRRKFLSAITWPLLQLAAAILIVGFLIWILGVIAQPGNSLQYDILGLGLTGNRGLLIYLAIVSAAGIVAFGLVKLVRSEMLWTAAVQRAVYRVPVVGRSLEAIALARLTWSLGLTLEAGMEVRRALTVGFRSAHSAIYNREIDGVVRRIEQGGTIHDALCGCGVLPRELLDAVDVGEQSGQLPETLLKQSEEYQNRAQAALAALAVVGGFLVWAIVAALIAGIAINVALGYRRLLHNLMKLH